MIDPSAAPPAWHTKAQALIVKWRHRAWRLGVDAEPTESDEAHAFDSCADDLEALVAACPPPSAASVYGSEVLCESCAKVFCPHGERGHFFHDGCPQCDAPSASAAPPGGEP